MEFTGKITFIGELELVGESEKPKRRVVLEEESDRNYPNSVSFEVRGHKSSILDNFNVGDVMTAYLNIRAREYNGKRYNKLSAWKIF